MTIKALLLLPLTLYTGSHLPKGHNFKILSKNLFSRYYDAIGLLDAHYKVRTFKRNCKTITPSTTQKHKTTIKGPEFKNFE